VLCASETRRPEVGQLSESADYLGREQTLVKHFILQKYLERFAYIVGSHWDTITYVDCFSGPWNIRSDELSDSSFSIALRELRKARDTYLHGGRALKLRCFFIEKDPDAFARLKQFADGVSDAALQTRNSEFAEAIPDIVKFVRQGGANAFPFIFVDPTGWSGFAMASIQPLLRFNPGEVLINFMTGHIKRFVESPQQETHESFEALFGSADFQLKIQGLCRQDREDALIMAYAENVKRAGRYKYVCSALVLHPEIDRTHFHLIYATRSPKGVEVFKDVEKKAMSVMEQERAEAQKRKRVRTSGQSELFEAKVLHRSSYYESLRERYLERAKKLVMELLKSRKTVRYDDAWELAVTLPLVWESDLKHWLHDWSAHIRIEGMEPLQRVPQREAGNRLVWVDRERGTD
jgi:three-Cys-motif partner protein